MIVNRDVGESSRLTDNRGLHLELDLPLTGIIILEDRVGMPSFNTPFCEADHHGNQASHFEAHYASQVALRRLCANLHDNINDCKSIFVPGILHQKTLASLEQSRPSPAKDPMLYPRVAFNISVV